MDADKAKSFAEYLLKMLEERRLTRPVFDFERDGDKLIPRENDRLKLPVLDPVLESEIVLDDILDAENIDFTALSQDDFNAVRELLLKLPEKTEMVRFCLYCGRTYSGHVFCGSCVDDI